MKLQHYILLIFITYWMIHLIACKHSPIISDDEVIIVDTIDMPMDTVIVNETDSIPCDPDVVYFELDILPILISNCAFSGCHDVASAEDGVILDSYENVIATADVEPFDLQHSEIYEVLVEDDEEKRMPPAPTARLDQDKIQLIAKWILQGGEDLKCDPDVEGCESQNVSYAADISPVFDLHCVGCHGGNTPSAGIDLSNHTGVKVVADNGRLYGSILWENGFSKMPQGGDKLSDCTIDKIKNWIDSGALDN